MDISRTNVLNVRIARDDADEKHLARAAGHHRTVRELWTNPGDIAFSPFAGIGSEIWQA
jgi:hypothetical protein